MQTFYAEPGRQGGVVGQHFYGCGQSASWGIQTANQSFSFAPCGTGGFPGPPPVQ
ncbi:MAG: hypothetical protein ACR2N4_09865 [Jatrophihabitans sp.]